MTVSYNTELYQPMRFYNNLSCGYGAPKHTPLYPRHTTPDLDRNINASKKKLVNFAGIIFHADMFNQFPSCDRPTVKAEGQTLEDVLSPTFFYEHRENEENSQQG